MKLEIPDAAVPAIQELLAELKDHWKRRPYPIRDAMQAWGLVAEEWEELKREIRKTDVGDSLDKVIHDLVDVAKISLSAYIDLAQAARSKARVCSRCGKPATRRAANGKPFYLCEACYGR